MVNSPRNDAVATDLTERACRAAFAPRMARGATIQRMASSERALGRYTLEEVDRDRYDGDDLARARHTDRQRGSGQTIPSASLCRPRRAQADGERGQGRAQGARAHRRLGHRSDLETRRVRAGVPVCRGYPSRGTAARAPSAFSRRGGADRRRHRRCAGGDPLSRPGAPRRQTGQRAAGRRRPGEVARLRHLAAR